MKKLDITHIIVENGARTIVRYHNYDTNSTEAGTLGSWVEDKALSNDEALELAKTRADAGIEVALNFEPLADVVNPE